MVDFAQIQTLDDLIEAGTKSDYALPLIVMKVKESDLTFLDYLCYDKYKNLIEAKCQTITLSDEEWRTYCYKPDLMSMKLYKTPNLSHLILFLNGGSIYKFRKKTVTLLPANQINDFLQTIILHESDRITRNNTAVK